MTKKATSQAPGKNVWVSPRPEGWAVQKEGAKRASDVLPTKKEAQDRGRDLAKKSGGELIVQKKDGQIGAKDSEGNDPRKSKG